MQSANDILFWLKRELGSPYVEIELDDKFIIEEIILNEAITIFSTFYPRFDLVPLLPFTVNNKFNDNTYFKFYSDTIFTIVNPSFIGLSKILSNNGDEINYEELENNKYRLGVLNRGMSMTTNSSLKDFNNHIVLKIKLRHDEVETIPTRLLKKFRELCLRIYAKKVVRIRNSAKSLQSTVGNIELYNDDMQELVTQYDDWFKNNFDNIRVNGTKRMLRFG